MPKTIIIAKNSPLIYTNNEPQSIVKTRAQMCKERDERIEEFYYINENKTLLAAQQEKLDLIFNWKIDMMQENERCFMLLSFEEIEIGDSIESGKEKIYKGEDENGEKIFEDSIIFSTYDGIVKNLKEVTRNDKAAKEKGKLYFIVI